jgi:hypothetical protein
MNEIDVWYSRLALADIVGRWQQKLIKEDRRRLEKNGRRSPPIWERGRL